LGGFGARFSGHLAGSLFDGLFFDHSGGFFDWGWRLFDHSGGFFDWGWCFFDHGRGFFDWGWCLFDHGRGFFDWGWRLFDHSGGFFYWGWCLFDHSRGFFWKGTAFRCRFAYRRHRGAVWGIRPVRLGANGKEERREHERDNQPKSKTAFGEDPR
jgi:hypothetical protein